jgi:hypothetical protein
METWKSVIGYDGWYEVSNQGRVRRIKAGQGTWPGRILKQRLDKNGYNCLELFCNGQGCWVKVHRLVAMAFLGLPTKGQEVNHKNGIKADNRVENLEWLTRSENHIHRSRILGIGQGETNGQAKLTNSDIVSIKKLLVEQTLNGKQIGELFGVSKGAINHIKKGRTWAHT